MIAKHVFYGYILSRGYQFVSIHFRYNSWSHEPKLSAPFEMQLAELGLN